MNEIERKIINMIQHYWYYKRFISDKEAYEYLQELKNGENPFYNHRKELMERAMVQNYELSHELFGIQLYNAKIVYKDKVTDVFKYQNRIRQSIKETLGIIRETNLSKK